MSNFKPGQLVVLHVYNEHASDDVWVVLETFPDRDFPDKMCVRLYGLRWGVRAVLLQSFVEPYTAR